MLTPTILFQPPNQIGLGHISRLAAIAQAVQRIDPGIQVPFAVAGSSHSLLEAYGIPYLSIPPDLDAVSEAKWSAWSLSDRQTTATSICYSILRGLQAQLVVFDCFPSWSMLRAAYRCRVKMILVLREMRDMAAYVETIRDAIPMLHSVVVVHRQGTVTLPPLLEGKAVYVGEVWRARSSNAILSHDERRYQIVVSGGGGGTHDALRLYNLSIDAITRLYRDHVCDRALLITGPLFNKWHELGSSDGVVLIPFEPCVVERFANADLVIAFSGYNTIADLSPLKVRVICMPSRTPYDDQDRRAAELAIRNPNVRVFSGRTSEELASLITDILQTPLKDFTSTRQMGSAKAAEYMCSVSTPVCG